MRVSGHVTAEHHRLRRLGICLVHDPSFAHDEDPVGEGEEFVEIGAHEKDGRAFLACAADPRVDGRGRAEPFSSDLMAARVVAAWRELADAQA